MMKKRINFIPPELRPKVEIPYEYAPLVSGALLAVVVIFNFTKIHVQSKMANEELAGLNIQNTELVTRIQTMTEENQRLEKKSETLNVLKQVLGRKNYWSEIFKELSNLVPNGIWLTSFANSDENQLVLKGESTSQARVADFLKALETSEHFSGARIKFTEREASIQPTRYKFEFLIPVTAATGGGT